MTTTEKADPAKVVATIIWTSPGLVMRGGLAYLRMKLRAKESSDRFRAGLEISGMPPERARLLTARYGADLSISKFIGGLGKHRASDTPPQPPMPPEPPGK